MLRFARTPLDINTFVTLFNCLLKGSQKQRSKYRSIISMLNKIFSKHFTVFNVFVDITANIIKLFSLPWIRTIHTHIFLLHSLLILFVCCLLLLVHFTIASVSSIFVSMCLHLFILTYVFMHSHFVL